MEACKVKYREIRKEIHMLCIFKPDIFLTIFIMVEKYLFCIEWPGLIS